MTDKRVVLVTCGSEEEASRIARSLVGERLAACVNIFDSPVRSVYRWKGRIETAMEHLLVIKTRRARMRALEAAVKRLHSYQTPEIIALPVAEGSRAYLAWLDECVRPGRKSASRPPRRRRRVHS
ncbi:MAG TPA: divalent-cation tolerance protein CutA [Candidatus Acidoferrales bacterium]|nr:divalent-cation tolerance protein CutA [Candidatus Acidoferrales bacterium]